MKSVSKITLQSLLACVLLWSLPAQLFAGEPKAADVDTAINSGEFTALLTNLTTWLSQKAPADPAKITPGTVGTVETVLKDPAVMLALAQRQFIAKLDPAKLGAFAKADPANKSFLSWLMKNSHALHEYLLAATPLSIPAREDNSYGLGTDVLETWKQIFVADPDSKAGLPLRLAIATALRPPGTGSPGSGQQKTHSDPLVRYKYFKDAHAKKELFPSFDNLPVWELQFVVCSGASETDLTWGREMVRTSMPYLLEGEKVVDSTSSIWRRNSPVPHVDYKTVLDGGGKCGPRSSWSVFICQAWGIPAIGVGQPRHACVAYKGNDGWHVAYGGGWNASKLEGMGGAEFVASVASREKTATFSRVERLRWLASTMPAKSPQNGAALALCKALSTSTPMAEKDLKASQKADEMDADPGALFGKSTPGPGKSVAKPEPPVVVPPGVIHVDGASYAETGGISQFGSEPRVRVMDSHTGGKQVLFAQGMLSCWVGYKINVPETGIYDLTAKVAVINSGQAMFVRTFGAMLPIKSATVTNVFHNQVKELGAQMAIDNNPSTRWAVNGGVDKASIDMDLGKPCPISTIMIDERAYEKVSKFILEYKLGTGDWKPILEGTTIGNSYAKDFPQVTADHVRLTTLDCSGNVGGPTFWEISLGTVQDGHCWLSLPWTAGLWETTKPAEIRLLKGAQTLWFFAPYQRNVAFKSFDLKLKSRAAATTASNR